MWMVLGLLIPFFGMAQDKPNIIIFLVDDWGVMDTSVAMLADENGNPKRHPWNDFYRTPNVERLAAQGVRFSSFYAHNVCSPTRISILTGQNAARHCATDWIAPFGNNGGTHTPADWDWEGLTPEEVSLPALLKKAGYTTIHVGKGHTTPYDRPGSNPLNIGFDVNVAGSDIGAPASYYGQRGYGKGGNPRAIARPIPGLEKYHGTDTYLTEALTLEANIELDKAIATKKPFFLNMAHYAVHCPFNPDPRFMPHYKDSDQPNPVKAYATMVEGVDKSLGDLMDNLEAEGVAEDTLIFVLGDNGADSRPTKSWDDITTSAPLRGRKGTRWEGGVRTVFIAGWAKVNPENRWQKKLPVVPNSMRQEIANVSDLFPTITALADAPVPADYPVDGHNLAKLFAGRPDPEHRNEFLSHYPHRRGRGVGNDYVTLYRKGDWKVVCHYLDLENRFELFNLKSDPGESNNLAASNRETLQSMLDAMQKALAATGAQYPVENGKPVGIYPEPKPESGVQEEVPPLQVTGDMVLIDFGRADNATPGYNNISFTSSGAASRDTGVKKLTDSSGKAIGWSIQVEGKGVGCAKDGADVPRAPAAVSGIPKTAWGDNLFTQELLSVSITGLDPAKKCDLLFYGSRANKQKRIQTWRLTKGTGGADVAHPSLANNTTVVDWKNIAPDASGQIEFTITVPGPAGALNFGMIRER